MLGSPRNHHVLSRITFVAMFTAVIGACAKDPSAPDEGREAARPQGALHLSYAASGSPHAFLGKVIHIESSMQRFAGVNECLDVENGVAVSNQYVNHEVCSYTARQQFYVDRPWPARADQSLVILRSQLDRNLCLDFQWGTTNGGEWLQLYPCHSGPNQVFQLPPQGWPNGGGYTQGAIYSEAGILAHKAMVLDAFLPFNTGWVQQYLYNGGANQIWWFRDAGTRRFL